MPEKTKETYTLKLKVTTKSKFEDIKEIILPDGSTLYKVYITKAPENGKANEAVIELFSKKLKIPKSNIKMIQGLKSKEKIIQYRLPS